VQDEWRALIALPIPMSSDALDRLGEMVGPHRYDGQGKLVGTALTIMTRPGHNLGMHVTMTLMKLGHVLVVGGGGDLNNALWGDLMRAYAVSRGRAGFVINGAMHDSACFATGDFP
jgi:regulator of RNase E activity RraA